MNAGPYQHSELPEGHPEKKERKKGRWWKRALLWFCLLPIILLLFFCTTGIRLDPLLPLFDGQLQTLPCKINRPILWVKCSLGRLSLIARVRGLKAFHEDSKPAVELGFLEVTLPFENLLEKKFLPDRLEINGLRLALRKTTDGKLELFPISDKSYTETQPWSTPEIPSFLQPLEELPFKAILSNLQVTVTHQDNVQHTIVPNASIETSYSSAKDSLHFDLQLTHPVQQRTTTISFMGSWNLSDDSIHARTEYAQVALEEWMPHLLPAGLPFALKGALDGHLAFALNLQTLQPREVDYSLGLDGLEVTADDWLTAPLAFAPFTLSGNVSFGNTLRAEFNATPLKAGPLELEFSPWVVEQNDRVNVHGEVRLHKLAAVSILDLVQPNRLASIPADSMALLRLDGTVPVIEHLGIKWSVSALLNKDYSIQDVAGSVNLGMDVMLKEERILPELTATYTQTGQASAKVSVEAKLLQPIVPARWSFLVAEHKVRLDCINLPLSFTMQTTASVNTAADSLPEIESLTVSVSGGPGELLPLPELSNDWVAPLKIDRLAFDLKSSDDLKRTEVIQGIIQLDEPSLDFSGTTLTCSASPLLGIPQSFSLKGNLEVTQVSLPWVCGLISEAHRSKLPLTTEEIASFTLKSFSLKTDTTATLFADKQPTVSGTIRNTTTLGLGETDWVWDAQAEMDAANGITARFSTQPLKLSQIKLPLMERFGVQPDTVHADFSLSGEAKLDSTGKPLSASGSLALSNGQVSFPPYLAQPFQWSSLSAKGSMDFTSGIFPLLEANLDSPLVSASFTMKDTALADDSISTSLTFQSKLPSLSKLISGLSPNIIPQSGIDIGSLQPNGSAETNLSLTYNGSIKKLEPEGMADLKGSLALNNVSIVWPSDLPIGFDLFRVELKEDSLLWSLANAQIDRAATLHAKGNLNELLGENPRITAEAKGAIDVSQAPTLIQKLPSQNLPTDLIKSAGGTITLHLEGNASLPTYSVISSLLEKAALTPDLVNWPQETKQLLSSIERDFTASATIDAKSVSLPALNEKLQGITFTPINATVRFDGNPVALSLSASANLDNLTIESYAKGSIQGGASAKLTKTGTLQAEIYTSLDDFSIALPSLGLGKAQGVPAHFRFTAKLDVASPFIPYFVNAPKQKSAQLSRLDFDVNYLFLLGGDFSGNLLFTPNLTGDFWGARRLQLNEIDLGNTHFDLEAKVVPDHGVEARLDGSLFDLQELLTIGTPVVYKMMLESPPQAPAKTQETAAFPPELALLGKTINAAIHFDQIRFTPSKQLTDFTGAFELRGLKPYQADLSAVESDRNLFALRIEPPKTGLHDISLIIPDCIALADIMLSPLEQLRFDDTELQSKINALVAVPDSFKGGVLQMQGKSTLGQSAGTLYDGNLRIDDLYLTTAPKILRILAQRTLKPITEQKAFNIFNVEKIVIDSNRYLIRNFRVEGPLTLNVKEALYSVPDELMTAEGDHALVNFWVKWPTDKPFGVAYIDLENKLIRALGTDISEFGDMGDF